MTSQNKDWLNERIGTYLKGLRKGAGLSQGDAASALGYSSNQFISNVERGVCTPSPCVIRNFLKIYKISDSKSYEDLLDIQMQYLNAELRGKRIRA